MIQPVCKVPFHSNLYHNTPFWNWAVPVFVSMNKILLLLSYTGCLSHEYWNQQHRSLCFTCLFNILCFYMYHLQKSWSTTDLCHNVSILEILSQPILCFTASFQQKRLKSKATFKTIKHVKHRDWNKKIYLMMCLPSGSGSLNKSECGYSWVVLFPISTDLHSRTLQTGHTVNEKASTLTVTKNKWKPTVMQCWNNAV